MSGALLCVALRCYALLCGFQQKTRSQQRSRKTGTTGSRKSFHQPSFVQPVITMCRVLGHSCARVMRGVRARLFGTSVPCLVQACGPLACQGHLSLMCQFYILLCAAHLCAAYSARQLKAKQSEAEHSNAKHSKATQNTTEHSSQLRHPRSCTPR